MSIDAYYDHALKLRDLLAERGYESWSRDLLVAERGACTSGEAINNIGGVLRRLRDIDLAGDLRASVDALLAEGDRIWDGG